MLLHSHGNGGRRRFGAGGARVEAACGFPSVYKVGLPALRAGARKAAGRSEPARVEACFALIAALEDTNLLHRGGMAGLRFALLLDGKDPRNIVRTEKSSFLLHDRVGQILCALQALVAAAALRQRLPDRLIVAGYSVGEVAAWGVAELS